MENKKIIKILTIIVSSIIVIGLLRKILQIEISSTQVGLFLFHVLPFWLIHIALIIYIIKSIINIIQNKVKITVIDIILIVVFIHGFISSLFLSSYLQVQ